MRFDRSPVMSTYLVAFVVGEFDTVERRTSDDVVVRCWCPKGKASDGVYAAELGVRILQYYTEYFGMPYPLPKLDMIGVLDFLYGGV